QDKYVANILKKFDFATVKTASTPIKTNKALLKDEEAEDVDVHLYRSMIGSLMYLTASRPNIMFVVCACARFQVTPKVSHLHAMKRIFRYLKGQPKLGLWYPRDSPFDLEAFSDSDYAGASLDRKSTTGGCQFLGKMLISWQCKKQTIVANSTTEAKYVAAANCRRQMLWIQNQMLDYGFNFMNTKIYIDNESRICSGPGAKIPYWGCRLLKLGLGSHLNRSNDPPLSKVNIFRSGEDSMQLIELMANCTKLSEDLQNDLKQTKLTYGAAYTKLILRVKKLEHKVEDPGSGEKGEKGISTAEVLVSTAILERQVYIKRSAEKRKDKGKAIMKDNESVQKKIKKQLEQERLRHEEAIRLQEQINKEERQRIARDA
ncbi:hypothetical protein Tco_0836360, partial [Tanacetum coccineum]